MVSGSPWSGGSSFVKSSKNCLVLHLWPLTNLSSQLKHNPLALLASNLVGFRCLMGRFGFGGGAGRANLAGGVGSRGVWLVVVIVVVGWVLGEKGR